MLGKISPTLVGRYKFRNYTIKEIHGKTTIYFQSIPKQIHWSVPKRLDAATSQILLKYTPETLPQLEY